MWRKSVMKHLGKTLGLMAAIALVMNLWVELFGRKTVGGLLEFLWKNPLVFLLNTVLFLVPFLMVLFTRRKIFWTMILVILELLMGIVNGVLLIFRTTPLTASDLRLVKYASSLLTTYLSWWQIVLGGAALILVLILIVITWKMAPPDREPVILKESVLVSTAAMSIIWGALNLAMMSGLVAIQFGNIGKAYEDYGFAYCFANSVFNTGIEKPDGYSVEAVTEIEEEELEPQSTEVLKEHQSPNIIMLQLESFSDPALWENSPVEEDPIPFFRFLKRAYPSGYLNVPSVGAGTANTEFECITAMNLDFFGPGEYPYKTVLQKTACESLPFVLKNLGYKTHAIHNNEGTFYDRHKVFAQLGFDTFTPMEYMYHLEKNETGWCKDKVLVEETNKILDSTLGYDFVYTISVQGHGKYPSFEYYCEQIHEMDDFIRELIISLNTRNEPTVLIMYGDHLPGFEWTAEEMKNGSLYQTEYVIWNNLGLAPERRDLETYQLASYVLNLLDIHEGTMVRFHQRYLNKAEALEEEHAGGNEDEEAYLAAMKVLEYDILYGNHEVYGGELPYQATKMEMGVQPIIQRTTIHENDRIDVYGEYFNKYSIICVNDKPVETIFLRDSHLMAKDIPYKEGDEITVQQIGRDKISLGTARKGPGA